MSVTSHLNSGPKVSLSVMMMFGYIINRCRCTLTLIAIMGHSLLLAWNFHKALVHPPVNACIGSIPHELFVNLKFFYIFFLFILTRFSVQDHLTTKLWSISTIKLNSIVCKNYPSPKHIFHMKTGTFNSITTWVFACNL